MPFPIEMAAKIGLIFSGSQAGDTKTKKPSGAACAFFHKD